MNRVYRPGDDPLTPRPMTQDQRDELVRRVRLAEASPAHRGAMLASSHRWGPSTRTLSPAAVLAIRQERASGRRVRELAALYGVSVATISRVARR